MRLAFWRGKDKKLVQRVPVKIRIPEPGALAGKLRPGLSSEVIVDTRDPEPDALAGKLRADQSTLSTEVIVDTRNPEPMVAAN